MSDTSQRPRGPHLDTHKAVRLMAIKATIFILVPVLAAGVAAILLLK